MRRSLRDHTDSDSNTPKFDLGDKPDEGGDEECGEWKVGTATGELLHQICRPLLSPPHTTTTC